MKKSLLSLLSLTAIMSITGCGGSDATIAPTPFKPDVAPTEVMLNSYSETMYVGESFELNLLVTPLMASTSKFVFTSSDESVATVSPSGVITARKAGSATITVQSERVNLIEKSVSIRVFDKITNLDKLSNKMKKLALYQAKNVTRPTKLITEQIKTYTLYKNDVMFSKSTQYNNIIVSKEDAYVFFGGRDTYVRIDGGSQTRDFGCYHIYCDPEYHSYIFHNGDNSNKYCRVATEFNRGTEFTQIDTVYSILDSLFNSGRKLVEDCIDDAMGTDWFDYSNLAASYGEKGEDELAVCFEQTGKGESTPLMEQNLDIPAYIDYTENDHFMTYWDKGNVKSYLASFGMTYYVKGVKHTLVIEERDTFTRDNFIVDIPSQGSYTEVADVFEL